VASTQDGYNFTFLQGIKVRSGTNYIGTLVAKHPDVQVVPPRSRGRPGGEFPVLRSIADHADSLDRFTKEYIGDAPIDLTPLLRKAGDAWVELIVQRFSLYPGAVFLKYPSVRGIEVFFKAFPDSRLIVLLRDGRDTVASAMKAALARRDNTKFEKKARRHLNHLIARDVTAHARVWATAARAILEFDRAHRIGPWSDRYLLVRYEDVFAAPEHWGERLFEFMGLSASAELIGSLRDVEVVGSSYFGAAGKEDARKPNWQPTARTEHFKPVGRWQSWNGAQKALFKRVAGAELAALNYADDDDW
jgi:hypothetical protein